MTSILCCRLHDSPMLPSLTLKDSEAFAVQSSWLQVFHRLRTAAMSLRFPWRAGCLSTWWPAPTVYPFDLKVRLLLCSYRVVWHYFQRNLSLDFALRWIRNHFESWIPPYSNVAWNFASSWAAKVSCSSSSSLFLSAAGWARVRQGPRQTCPAYRMAA